MALLDADQNQGVIRVMVVRDPTIPPTTLLKQDVIIVSYPFVMSRHRKKVRYLEKIADMKKTGGQGILPERPNLCFFSEIFEPKNNGPKSPYIILDEVNAVKNSRSLTFAAVLELRKQCDVCLMLTGSPIDNTWPDIFSFLQFVEGHDIRNKTMMMKLLATQNLKYPGRYKPPQGQNFLKFIQILNHFIVRRPESIINLPPLHKHIFKFELNLSEELTSNATFDIYQKAINIKAKEGKGKGQKRGTAFKSLRLALQEACHPNLVSLMAHLRREEQKDQIDEEDDVLYDAESIKEWETWRERLKENSNWQSSRINALIDVFNKQRDLDPKCSVIIFDESVYFLDIVQIAFESMYEPVESLRYDGRVPAEKRGSTLTDFREAEGAKVLLMSRAAGGVGLNIAWANVVIQCSPWWKAEWEVQAMKRAWRPGAQRPVTHITLLAENCKAEHYKAKARDRKHRFNTKVMDVITRDDDHRPDVWDDF
ncbi:hypothetical protein N0V83_003678 [Neocucurbitaria cava]|uniref:Helicase C-terminal domain-containing protein n=1 Tax=Neocucurbitaria cava TaxID=798079 RepID=A0A9W8YBK3_9PLEO|nr:hypothetical protein N0V83_003678 [Neocucurbitaria cava]